MTIVMGYLSPVEGRTALGHAIRECTVHKDGLVVVVPQPVADGAEFTSDLSLAEASLGQLGISVRRVESDAALGAELIDLSYDHDTALVVVGVRRRSPVGKLVMGSIAQTVILEARCPVTAVKPPVTAQE